MEVKFGDDLLKELQNCISRIIRIRSLICSVWVYLIPHLLSILLKNLVIVFLCFLSVLFQFDVISKDFKHLITYSFLCSHYMTKILVKYKNCDIKIMPPLEVLSFLKMFHFKFHFTNKFYL